MAGDAPRGDSLRALDWRFLLPEPPGEGFEHLVLLGGGEALPGLLRELGVARRVSRSLPDERSADAVVLLPGARVPVERAAAALVPGGTLCWQVERRTPGHLGLSPRRARARLRRVGVEGAAVYWAKGTPGACSMYLPLESEGALAWYFEVLYGARTPGRRLLRALLRAATGWRGSRFGALVPTFTVVARAGHSAPAGPAVLSGGGLPAPLREPGLHPVVLLGGQGDWSRVVLLPFRRSGSRPVGVVKLPRLPVFNGETEHERSALLRVRHTAGAPLRDALPEPLGSYRWQGLTVAVESCVSGRSLYRAAGAGRTGQGRAVGDLRLAAAWLVDFHLRTERGRPTCAAEAERLVEQPLAAYTATFGATEGEERLFVAFRRRAATLSRAALPRVWQHRDFGPWNLYRSGDRLSVIDWEVAREGPALCDLLYLAMHWSWTARGMESEPARQRELRALFVDPTPADGLVSAARAELHAYMAALDMDPGLLPLLLVHTLLEQALDRAGRLRAGGSDKAGAREGNRYVGYLGVLTAHVERLFAGPPPARREVAA